MNMNATLRSVDLHDPSKLLLIVFSAIAILMAGFLSRVGFDRLRLSELQESDLRTSPILTEGPIETLRKAAKTSIANSQAHSTNFSVGADSPTTAPIHPPAGTLSQSGLPQKVVREVEFAESELVQYRNLIRELRQRTADESSPVNIAGMKAEIANVEDRARDLQNAIRVITASAATAQDPFVREDLHESLLALQDAGHRAVASFVNYDNGQGADLEDGDGSQTLNLTRTGQ